MTEKTRKILEYTLGAPAILWGLLSMLVVILLMAILSIPLVIFEWIIERNS